MDHKQPLALYLKGWVLKQTGRDREGEKPMVQAHWLPLADSQVRSAFVKHLSERGQDEAMTREGELMMRLSQPGSSRAAYGMRVYNFASISHKDYSGAAKGYERAMLIYLDSAALFFSPAIYVGMPRPCPPIGRKPIPKPATSTPRVARWICVGSGLARAMHFVPAELVPMWDKAGHKKEATELFEKYLVVQEKLCADLSEVCRRS